MSLPTKVKGTCKSKCSRLNSACKTGCEKKCVHEKKLSKRNIPLRNKCKSAIATGDTFPECPELGCFFYWTEDETFYFFNGNDWVPMCGSINVETSDTEFGPVNAGPFTINTCGDTLRLWSAGGISASVTPGSALIEVEPNIIFIGDGEPQNFSPADPTRPAFFMNSSNGDTYMWNPDDPNGTVEHWAMNSVYPIHVNVDGPTGLPPSGSNPHFPKPVVGDTWLQGSSGNETTWVWNGIDWTTDCCPIHVNVGGPTGPPTPGVNPHQPVAVVGDTWIDGSSVWVWNGIDWIMDCCPIHVNANGPTGPPTAGVNPHLPGPVVGDVWLDGGVTYRWNGVDWRRDCCPENLNELGTDVSLDSDNIPTTNPHDTNGDSFTTRLPNGELVTYFWDGTKWVRSSLTVGPQTVGGTGPDLPGAQYGDQWINPDNGDTYLFSGNSWKPVDYCPMVEACETLTSLSMNSGMTGLEYQDEDGTESTIGLCPAVKACETVTSISLNGTGLSYINELGITTVVDLGGVQTTETLTTLSVVGSTGLQYFDENGDNNIIDICPLVRECELTYPEPNDIVVCVRTGGTIQIDLKTNTVKGTYDVDNDEYAIESAAAFGHSVTGPTSSGILTYVAKNRFTGFDKIIYSATDSEGNKSKSFGTITIHVLCNSPGGSGPNFVYGITDSGGALYSYDGSTSTKLVDTVGGYPNSIATNNADGLVYYIGNDTGNLHAYDINGGSTFQVATAAELGGFNFISGGATYVEGVLYLGLQSNSNPNKGCVKAVFEEYVPGSNTQTLKYSTFIPFSSTSDFDYGDMEYDPFSSTFIHSDQLFSVAGNNGQYEIINLQGDVVKTIIPPTNPTTAFQIALGDDNLFYINLGTSIFILEPATGQQTAVVGAVNLLASPTDMARPIRGCFDNTILQ